MTVADETESVPVALSDPDPDPDDRSSGCAYGCDNATAHPRWAKAHLT
jgi:hypothetical protein